MGLLWVDVSADGRLLLQTCSGSTDCPSQGAVWNWARGAQGMEVRWQFENGGWSLTQISSEAVTSLLQQIISHAALQANCSKSHEEANCSKSRQCRKHKHPSARARTVVHGGKTFFSGHFEANPKTQTLNPETWNLFQNLNLKSEFPSAVQVFLRFPVVPHRDRRSFAVWVNGLKTRGIPCGAF